MSNLPVLGDRVRHVKRPDVGVGKVTITYPNGYCDAAFPESAFSWIPLDCLSSVELEERERERHKEVAQQVRAESAAARAALRRIMQSNFLDCDEQYETNYRDVITVAEFEEEKCAFVKSWLLASLPPGGNAVKQAQDDEQLAAIAAVHGHVQVVARAGSGKTATLVNRAHFLLGHCGVDPGSMLLLAFNRKAATEVRRRLLTLIERDAENAIRSEIESRARNAGRGRRIERSELEAECVDAVARRFSIALPHVMTFHALAYAIVHPEESLLHDGPEGEAQGLSRAFQRGIDDHLQVPAYRGKIRDLMLAHFREDWDRIVSGRFDQSRDELLRFRRSLPRESLGGEYVKSFGEKLVADFLFEYDIAYKYERNHWWGDVNYRPDFTIFKTPKSGLIIEYFGLAGDPDYDINPPNLTIHPLYAHEG